MICLIEPSPTDNQIGPDWGKAGCSRFGWHRWREPRPNHCAPGRQETVLPFGLGP